MIDYAHVESIVNDDGAIKKYLISLVASFNSGTLYNFPPPESPHLLSTLQRIFNQMNMDYNSVNNPTRLGFIAIPDAVQVKEEPKTKKQHRTRG